MQLLVIAEGVETREQQVILKNMGASFLQGYLYSEPVPMAEFDSMLDNKMKFLKSAWWNVVRFLSLFSKPNVFPVNTAHTERAVIRKIATRGD